MVHISSMLGTLCKGHFLFHGESAEAHLVIVTKTKCSFPSSASLVIEGDKGKVYDGVAVTYPTLPLLCEKCDGFNHCPWECVARDRKELMLASDKILGDSRQTPRHRRTEITRVQVFPPEAHHVEEKKTYERIFHTCKRDIIRRCRRYSIVFRHYGKVEWADK